MTTTEEKLGENWDEVNLETLSEWLQISSLLIETLNIAIKYYRNIMRKNVLFGLICSTASGSISVTQLNSDYQKLALSILFTTMSFSIAISTGLVKIYQVQERLEEFIQLKQEWISFSVNITSEIQLPKKERIDALKLIREYKNKYLDLLKRDIDVPTFIKSEALKNLYDDKGKYLNHSKRYYELKKKILYGEENTNEGKKRVMQEQQQENQYQYQNNCCYDFLRYIYNLITNNNDMYDGRKTSLSNIILTIVLDEEENERDIKMSEIHKSIKKKRDDIKNEKKLDRVIDNNKEIVLELDIEAPLSTDTNINEDKESMIFLS